MPISCHFRDCKALLVTSLTHVSGAITIVLAFAFTFIGTVLFCREVRLTFLRKQFCCIYRAKLRRGVGQDIFTF